MEKRRVRKAVLPVMAWDTLWKILAIRRALQLRDYKWIAGIVVTNSAGVLPMYYLWKKRGEMREDRAYEPPLEA